jgi:NTP pyrophosphatase (non-canonical NTP hydrolase)
MSDLANMTRRLLRFREERDWQQFHNVKDQILSLNLEAAELLELCQWRQGEALEAHLRDKQRDVADELCDVLGWVLLIAHDRGIDLPTAFEDKMKRNEQKYPVDKARGRATKYSELAEVMRNE